MSDTGKRIANLSLEARAALEKRLVEGRGAARKNRISPRTDKGPCVLSFAQERIYFLEEMSPGTGVYNIPRAFRVKGPLDAAIVGRALELLAVRHEVLRTRFVDRGEGPMQELMAEVRVALESVDLSALPPGERETELARVFREASRRPFDLSQDALLRATVARLGEEEFGLLFVMHHIAADGWSMGIFVRELTQAYEALASGNVPAFALLPIQYADFALWQRQALSGDELERQVAYWRKRLEGAPEVLDLPTDRPRARVLSSAGARQRWLLSPALGESLKAFARAEGATLFMTLLAAFSALLYRYTGQEDISIGTPVAGRSRVETEKLVGLFLNTLVLRADLSSDPSFRELVRRIKDTALSAFSHQDLPFEKLVEALRPERDMGRTPLFQVMFILQNAPRESMQIGGLELRSMDIDPGTAKFDLTLSLSETKAGIVATVGYRSDLFDASTIARFLQHYEVLLASAVEHPDRRTSELSILTPAETRELLSSFNDTRVDFARERTALDLFYEARARSPEKAAIFFEGESLSYRELDERANRLARELVEHGIGPGRLVGIAIERSVDMVVALLGVLKTGGAYVPLDPSYPRERLAFMMEDARIRVLLTDERNKDLVPRALAEVICIDTDWPKIARHPNESLSIPVSPESLAYVIYTSGSTGRPKGVQVPHRALANFLSAMAKEPGIRAEDKLLSVTSLSFDIAGLEIFLPLSSGASVEIASRAMATDGAALASRLARGDIGLMQATPSTYRLLSEAGWEGNRDLVLLVGGEALPQDLAQTLLERAARVFNMYGPTETTIWSSLARLLPDDKLTIGLPIANTEMHVLDGHMNLQPIGVAGELYIGGEGLARGYLRRPGLSAERFVPNPFGQAGSRLYRTGDLCRRLSDGRIEFLGRVDHQIKLRGYRIELGEIEAILLTDPAIAEACVVAREDRPGDPRLVAYLVPVEGGRLEPAELRRELEQLLPAHMVPSAFVVLERLPRTPNGKTDRKALPVPDLAVLAVLAVEEQSYCPPETPVEEILAGIWAELLGAPRIGRDDDFFALGGHSLLAARVVARARAALGVDLPLKSLFEAPTLRAVASQLTQLSVEKEGTKERARAPIARRSGEGPYPLSFAQERIYFLEQMTPGTAAYNVPIAYRVRGPLDLGALERALVSVVSRHEALRTTFASVDGKAVQIIHAEPRAPFEIVDLRELSAEARELEGERVLREAMRRPFDLSRDAMMRAMVVRYGEADQAMLFVMHHIASDGWSMGIFQSELCRAYEHALGLGDAPRELPIQTVDVALHQRATIEGGKGAEDLAYWKRALEGAPPELALPLDHPRPRVMSYRGAARIRVLPRTVLERARSLSQREGCTLFMTLLSAFEALLHRYSGQSDILVGSPVSGRSELETEGLIGLFINMLVFRARFDERPSFRALLASQRKSALEAYAHQDLPFEKLVIELRPERRTQRSPIFQASFILQNTPREKPRMAGLELAPLKASTGTAKFDITLSATETEEGLRLALSYSADLFEPETIDRMLTHYGALLDAALESPETPVDRLPLFGEEERLQLIQSFNDTRVGYERELSVVDRFCAQAASRPDAPALLFEGEELSYRALDERSNQLARALAARGVRPGVLVGVALERSLDMVVALLGVLKAGGAYVPLDPSYPEDRLAFMMEDAGISIVLREGWTRELLLAEESNERLPLTIHTESLAYVIYTSGSTGKPKGVQVPHRALANFLSSMAKSPGIRAQDRVLSVTSLSFDIAGLEIFLPLSSGASVEIASRAMATDGTALASRLSHGDIRLMQATPSTYRLLIEAGWEGNRDLVLLVGGEALPSDLADSLLSRAVSVWNMYGPTETTIWSSIARLLPNERVTIGRPIDNTQIYVLDRELAPVPLGAPGELYIGGEGLAHGYLKRPGLSAERFMPDPFGRAGGRLYRTGDLARRLSDGRIEFLGRVDHQVKVRGYRIELGEIESALLSHESVREAVVIAREERAGDARLVAYVGLRAPALFDELRSHLRAKLPAYMVPSAIVVMEALPLTPNGKIDRKALPAPEQDAALEQFVPLETPTEERLAAIWAELLRLPRVGASDDFFEKGGHSLLAAQMIARVRSSFGVELPLRALFEAPTLREVALAISQAHGGRETGAASASIPRRSKEKPLVLSFAQERIFFFEQMSPGTAVYNIPVAYRLTGPLDLDRLKCALLAILDRHEVLRTRFFAEGGVPRAELAAGADLELAFRDLRDLPAEAREDEGKRFLRTVAREPFELGGGRLLRAACVRYDEALWGLLLVTHHIASDGWSTTLLLRELSRVYEALAGQGQALSALPIQYADFAAWQREESSKIEDALSYFQHELEGAPPFLELPTDFARPATPSHKGAALHTIWPRELTEKVHAFARGEGVTLFMTLLAAYELLLYRISGQSDLVVGSPVAGRTRVETESLVGLFINTLVFRARFDAPTSFRALVGDTRRAVLSAFAFQDLPFEKLVEALKPERIPGRSPLFQVSFMLQNMPKRALSIPGVSAEPLAIGSGTSKFDLTLVVSESESESESGLKVLFDYSAELFERATIERIAASYRVLVEDAIARPDTLVSRLSISSGEELARLVHAWNQTSVEPPPHATVVDSFRAQVGRAPHEPALAFEGASLTYAELEARSNQLARRLRARGVGPGALVGVALERSLDMVVALLGVLEAGGAYVPLDPSYPEDRIAFMMEDAGISIVLREGWASDPLLAEESQERLPLRIHPESLAYVIYTSGSTGKPKGVQVSHRALANFLWTMAKSPGIRAEDKLLAVTSLSFDIAGLEIFLPLSSGASGASVEIASRALALDGAALAVRLDRGDISLMQATPSTYRLLIEAGWKGNRDLVLLVGGEALPSDLAESLLSRAGSVWNMYGPTETTIWSSIARLLPGDRVTIGHPIGNTQVYVLDPELAPVPLGTPGELFIGGDGLAHGYLKRPGLTAERFVPDPFGRAGGRLYRTGDLGRRLSDGRIEFLGRVDHQVKVRGYRIELGEIESALLSHESVREAVVIAREERAGDTRLVAYVGLRAAASTEELRAHVQSKLPAYMVPSAIVVMEALPLTPNGKIDRKRLPAPELGAGSTPSALALPPNPIEARLIRIFEEVLGASGIGLCDNFFDLGGHSLLAARIVARIHDAFGLDLPVRTLFEAPTVSALGVAMSLHAFSELKRQRERGTSAALSSGTSMDETIVPRDVNARIPLSFAQERLWFLEQVTPGTAVYNMPMARRVKGELHLEALEKALSTMVARHEILRTAFVSPGGEPVAVVEPDITLALERIDFEELERLEAETPEEREERVLALVRERGRRPFDLTRAPLLRAVAIRLGDHDWVLLFVMHHIVGDAWSLGLFFRELSSLYQIYRREASPRLAELAVQYADFAIWQRKRLSGAALDELLAYWKKELADAPPFLDLPLDHPRPAMMRYRGATRSKRLSQKLLLELKSLCRDEGASLFMALFGAFAALLARYSGQQDLVIGTPIAGRVRVETEPLIGLFINTLAIRVKLSQDPSFRELIARVREVTLGAYAHQEMPFEKLAFELRPERVPNRTPIFQVHFILQNAERDPLELDDARVSAMSVGTATSKFDITMVLWESAGGLGATIEYDADLFESETIDRMLEHYQLLLEGVTREPDRPVSAIELCTPTERRALLVEFNDTRMERERKATVVELFESAAERAPSRIAVEFEGASLSYAELDRRSNQLARALRRRGVGPGVLVGIGLERSLDMVVALLGVLKAGGAYVPLDPNYPADRIAFMMEDAGISIVLREGFATELLAEEQSSERLSLAIHPESLAYVIYTSGSTGKPKGVKLPHRALANFLATMRVEPGISSEDKLLAVTSLSFDIAGLEIFLPLVSGASVEIASRALALDGAALAERIDSSGVTLFQATPSTYRLLFEAGWQGKPSLKALVGGEAVPSDLAAKLVACVGTAWNMYGPTETTIWSAISRLGSRERVTIGRPIGNTRIYILDASMRLLPLGAMGELYIGGEGLAHGYLGRPALTAERFLPDPFSPDSSARLYRTGDLCRYLPDGNIEFLGRVDHQIKLRGYRIELGEIESVLLSHSSVREATVLLREDRPGDPRLVAYVGQRASVEEETLRAHCKEKLPAHMVPSAFVVMDALPKTPNNKIDRKSLPAPALREIDASRFVAPRDEVEQKIASIWGEVLGVSKIGAHDNFFDLGGHSLLAVRMLAGVEDAFFKKVPLAALFEHQTLSDLAKLVRDEGHEERWRTLVAIKSTGALPPLFCVSTPNVNALGYVALARYLSPDQPLYGLQSQYRDEGFRPYEREEFIELAREYIAEMKKVAPHGPYFFCGMCEGAHICFEMVRLLESEGEEVAFLGILDAWPIENTRNYALWRVDVLRVRLLRRLRALENKSGRERVEMVLGEAGVLAQRLVGRKKPGNGSVPTTGEPQREDRKSVEARFIKRYWPGPDFVPDRVPVLITLFRIREQPFWRINDPQWGWGSRTTEGVDTYIVPGDHFSILREPHVKVLAEKITGCMERARGKERGRRNPAG